MSHYNNSHTLDREQMSFTSCQLLAHSLGEYELLRPDIRKSAHHLLCKLESASLYRCLRISTTTERELSAFLSGLDNLTYRINTPSAQQLRILNLIDMLVKHHRDNMLQILLFTNLEELSFQFVRHVQAEAARSNNDSEFLQDFTQQLMTLLMRYLTITGTVFSTSTNIRMLPIISQHVKDREELDVLRWID